MLQSWELQAFDQLMRLRPNEAQDPRLLIVTISEEDFQLKEQKPTTGSLSDLALAQLLEKLEPYQPRAIGLDIYRDFPVASEHVDLAKRLRHSEAQGASFASRFFAICKVSTNDPGIAPPPEIPAERLGFSDLVIDPDGILRRHLLAMNPGSASPCSAPYALSAQLALRYLAAEGIFAKYTPKGELQVGDVIFKRWRSHMGGYQQIDDRGYQILLNYRSHHSPLEIAEKVTLKDVLTGKVKPETVKDRIILIGVAAIRAGNYFATPYSASQGSYEEMPGVIAHAQMVSQILSAVKDGRTLLWVWPVWGEILWVWGWSFVGGVLAWRFQSIHHLGLAVGASLFSLYGLGFGFLLTGGWVPLVPSVLALLTTGTSLIICFPSSNQRQQRTSTTLESRLT
jgi:CHASE2 domain-containing sensor protein